MKKLLTAFMLGVSLIIGSVAPASAADVWACSDKPQHRECTHTDIYIVTESTREFNGEFGGGFTVNVKLVNQPMGRLERTETWKFFIDADPEHGRGWIFNEPHRGQHDIEYSVTAQKILDACKPYTPKARLLD